MTPQEKTIQKAIFIQNVLGNGISLKQAEQAYKNLLKLYGGLEK